MFIQAMFSCILPLELFFVIKKRKRSFNPKLLLFSMEDAFSSPSESPSFCAAKSNYGAHPLFKENISVEDYCLTFSSLPSQPSSTLSKY